MISVLIADDQPAVLHGLRMRLEIEPDIDVVGVALSGEAAVEQTFILRPDVVIMDVAMPGIGGIAASRRITDGAPAAVIVVSLQDDAATRAAAAGAGASAFIAKHEADGLLTATIRRVATPPTTRRSTGN